MFVVFLTFAPVDLETCIPRASTQRLVYLQIRQGEQTSIQNLPFRSVGCHALEGPEAEAPQPLWTLLSREELALRSPDCQGCSGVGRFDKAGRKNRGRRGGAVLGKPHRAPAVLCPRWGSRVYLAQEQEHADSPDRWREVSLKLTRASGGRPKEIGPCKWKETVARRGVFWVVWERTYLLLGFFGH